MIDVKLSLGLFSSHVCVSVSRFRYSIRVPPKQIKLTCEGPESSKILIQSPWKLYSRPGAG